MLAVDIPKLYEALLFLRLSELVAAPFQDVEGRSVFLQARPYLFVYVICVSRGQQPKIRH